MPKKSKESPISAEKAAESTPSTVTTTEETEVIPVVSIEVFSLDAGKFINKSIELTPEQRAASKEFIAEFAKEYAREPE
jgi:hypothetical protein